MRYALTDTRAKNAKPAEKSYKVYDGGGLYLFVTPNGSKSWRYKYRLHGREYVFALGLYPDLGVKDARTEHAKARDLVEQGVHPLHARKKEALKRASEAENTFAAVTKEWMAKKRSGWSATYCQQLQTVMDDDVLPEIGALPIGDVSSAQILKIMKRVEGRGAPVLALNIRMWCSAIYDYAVANGHAETNPAVPLRGAVVRPKVKHNKRLTAAQIPGFYKKLQSFNGHRLTAIALELMLLTFVRTKELRQAEWTEFDLKERTWEIPAERMKMGEKHIVPLSDRALELIQELKTLTGAGKYLFPNRRRSKQCMSATTVNAALVRLGYEGRLSGHGFRGTASTQLHELGWRPELIERQLAHAERNKVKAAYNAAQYLVERRQMMQAWSDFVQTGGKVVPLKSVA